MNRITALLLAMAALLVHVLVVHRSAVGGFAPPFESAHAALHVGRVLAREGLLAWSVDPATGATAGGLWSYPSPLLVGVAAVAERVYYSSTFAVQLVGIVCVLLTVFLSTRFDTDRIAGVVPALLLVSSGAVAVAGASGTEWPIAMFLLATAFVALEHCRSRFAALALALLVVARPEGIVAAAVLAIQTALRRRSARRGGPPVPRLWVFLPALLTLGAAHALGASLVEDLGRILRPVPDAAAARHGLAQLRDFAVTTISPFLLLFPLVALAIGELTPVGRRALALAAACWTASVLAGGGPAAFDLAFTMALPIVFIAIQQGIARALDTYRASMERLSWLAIAAAILGSLLASRFPGDLGRFGLRDLQERVRVAAAVQPPGHGRILGRSAHFAEIRLTSGLRRVGGFLRDRLPPEATVLSAWPGALGYLANVRVVDMFGRATRLPGVERASWSPDPGGLDLRAALATEPDYIVPTMGGVAPLVRGELDLGLPEVLFTYDPDDGPELRADVAAALARYEIVVTTGRGPNARIQTQPLLLLRRRGLADPPRLRFRRTKEGVVDVSVGFGSTEGAEPRADLPQVYDAVVVAVQADGTRLVLDPAGGTRGRERPGMGTRTIVGAVIDPRWPRAVSLARIPPEALASGPGVVRLEARLLHHRLPPDDPTSNAADPLTYPLR
ncbi:MAG: hypothetical protein AAGB93_07225 [Planctomycetota bacterium]